MRNCLRRTDSPEQMDRSAVTGGNRGQSGFPALACLGQDETPEIAEAIRRNTHTGRPLGTPGFVERLEQELLRRLASQRGGRPRQQPSGSHLLAFD